MAFLTNENERALFYFTTSQTFENRSLLLLWWPALFLFLTLMICYSTFFNRNHSCRTDNAIVV